MNKGFTLVEILLSVALFAIFIPALVYVLSLSTFTVSQGESFATAYAIGQEQLEAIITLKNQNGPNWDWVSTPATTNLNEYYQPNNPGTGWQLGSITSDPDLTAKYTPLVEIKPIKRCVTSVCTEAWGNVDDFSRQVNVKVVWQERGQEQSINLTMLVTQI